jgi:hypothetical protein
MAGICTALVVFVLAVAAAGCGQSQGPAPATHTRQIVRLTPGHYTFRLGGRVNVGDEIRCVTRDGSPAGGGAVPTSGHGVGSSTGFSLSVSAGEVTITCPARVGVM